MNQRSASSDDSSATRDFRDFYNMGAHFDGIESDLARFLRPPRPATIVVRLLRVFFSIALFAPRVAAAMMVSAAPCIALFGFLGARAAPWGTLAQH